MTEAENKEDFIEEEAEEIKEGADIDFDDDVDLDKYKKQFTEADKNEDIESKDGIAIPAMVFDQQITSKQKKYVIYIDPDNIDFIENLSLPERKKLINNILNNEIKVSEKTKQIRKQKKLFSHLTLICFSAIIFLPLAFFIINKSLELSIINYSQSEQNFEKLYKTRGKLKAKENIYSDLK